MATLPYEPYISLCSGIGGLDLGVHAALRALGRRPRAVCYIEREITAAQVLAKRMEEGNLDAAPIWSDITTFDALPWRGKVRGVVGGIPCQPHSHAGKRAGKKDGRNLWPDAERIIEETGAEWLFLENVDGILSSSGGEAVGQITQGLARLGFTEIRWIILAASAVGAPHRRNRFFLFARRPVAHIGSEVGRRAPRLAKRGSGTGSLQPRQTQPGRRDGHVADGNSRRSPTRIAAELPGDDGNGDESLPAIRRESLAHFDEAGFHEEQEQGDEESQSGHYAHRGNGQLAHGGRKGLEGRQGIQGDVGSQRSTIERGRDGLAVAASGWPQAFPPGPSDFAAWDDILSFRQDLVPAIPTSLTSLRGMDDGLADELERLQVGRPDRLGFLGNGVVPIQASTAFLILWEV